MPTISHEEQRGIWEREHKSPYVLKQMDSPEPSQGIVMFWSWLKPINSNKLKGLEICCGKGRNVIWSAKKGLDISGFDFSTEAVKEANKRAQSANINPRIYVHDALKSWLIPSNTLDFVIDCFATTDIETPEGREFIANQINRVLKPGGYLCVYTLSTDSKFHRKMVNISPAIERNAFLHPITGKFEKTFTKKELMSLYKKFELIVTKKIQKTTEFLGKEYKCKNYWMIFQK